MATVGVELAAVEVGASRELLYLVPVKEPGLSADCVIVAYLFLQGTDGAQAVGGLSVSSLLPFTLDLVALHRGGHAIIRPGLAMNQALSP